MKKKTAILLVNLGSPDSPEPADVYRYLTQFLNDPRVIDLNWLARTLLVNALIVPFRHRKTSGLYKRLWTENGSPLIYYGNQIKKLLQNRFEEEETKFFLAMRYQNPSIQSALVSIDEWSPSKLIVIPLFPQYASASTGSVIEKIMTLKKKSQGFFNIEFITQFYDYPLFAEAIAKQAEPFKLKAFDHILFSYHGLPERQLDKLYEDRKCKNHFCETVIEESNQFCYKATCFATSRALATALGIEAANYTVCFQSRLGGGWIEPFTDKVLIDCAKKGMKNLLVFSPSFVADCLETTIEIGEEYQNLFAKHGGNKVQLVPSLNESSAWIDILENMVRSKLA